jgi:hypothetical protein
MATAGTESDRAADAGPPEGLIDTAARLGHKLLAVIGAGFICGGLIGGVGGRIAMFVLRLTSDDGIRRAKTDDGFEIGVITTSMIFLIVATAFLGAACGLLYLATRRFVPERHRLLVSAVLFGAIGGALVLKPGEFDFTVIGPPLLSVVLFILIPAAFGVALSRLAELFLDDTDRAHAWYWATPMLLIVLAGSPGLVVLVATALGLVLADRYDSVRRAWQSSAVLWGGRAALTGLIAFCTVDTVQAAVDII